MRGYSLNQRVQISVWEYKKVLPRVSHSTNTLKNSSTNILVKPPSKVPVPYQCPAQSKFIKGNLVLVGDSAGMVPSNGAGITIAMVGGRIAGQTIADT